MGQDTPNFDLYKPREGEDGWAQEVNDNWDTIDSTLKTTEAVQDIVGGLIQANGNISVTYDDANDVLTVDTTALNEEEVEDAVAALVTEGNAITVNYDDANDALSISVDESSLSFYDGTSLTADVDNESVNTGSVIPNFPSGAQGSYEFVGTIIDDDFKSTLDAEITGIGDYDILEIHYAMRPSGTGFDQVFGRINGLSDANYRYDSTTGATEWRIGTVNNASPTTGIIQITGSDFDSSVDIEPYFWTEGSSNEGESHAGRYTTDQSSVNSFRLFSNTENAGIRAHVRGMTL